MGRGQRQVMNRHRQMPSPEQVSPDDIRFYANECRTPRQFSILMRKLQSCIPFQNLLCCCKNAKTYKVVHMADLDYPSKFHQWYQKANKIYKDPLFNECLRAQQCQIWTDLFRHMPYVFDPEYVDKVKEFNLVHTMAGAVLDIPRELACYFSLTMRSEQECHNYIKVLADVLPALSRAIINAYGSRPPFNPPLLTERQKHLLQLAAEGLSRRAIAHSMGIVERTVQMHLAAVRKKLRAKNQVHAVALAIRYKLIG